MTRIEPVEACRTLVRALHRCGPEIAEHPAAVVLRAFDSETDAFPVGQQRDSWNPHELARLDCERDDYWRQVGSEVRRACAELVAVLDRLVHHSVILEMTGPSVRADEAEQARKETATTTTETTTTTKAKQSAKKVDGEI